MAPRAIADATGADDREPPDPDPLFQAVSGTYAGVILAEIAAIVVSLTADESSVLAAYAAGFTVGAVAGVDRALPIRLGRSLARRVSLGLPATLFGLLWLAPLGAPVDAVALVGLGCILQ